jgi:hypothetical protein
MSNLSPPNTPQLLPQYDGEMQAEEEEPQASSSPLTQASSKKRSKEDEEEPEPKRTKIEKDVLDALRALAEALAKATSLYKGPNEAIAHGLVKALTFLVETTQDDGDTAAVRRMYRRNMLARCHIIPALYSVLEMECPDDIKDGLAAKIREYMEEEEGEVSA